MLFTKQRYASLVYAVIECTSVCPSVHHALVLYRNG